MASNNGGLSPDSRKILEEKAQDTDDEDFAAVLEAFLATEEKNS